jgi:hypothetical protein
MSRPLVALLLGSVALGAAIVAVLVVVSLARSIL